VLWTVLLSAVQGCAGLRNLEPPDVVVTAIRPVDATLLEQRFDVDLRSRAAQGRPISTCRDWERRRRR
jgi:hypothetical protein